MEANNGEKKILNIENKSMSEMNVTMSEQKYCPNWFIHTYSKK